MTPLTLKRWGAWNGILFLATILVILAGLTAGGRFFSLPEIFQNLFGAVSNPDLYAILTVSRLPRVLLAGLCGMALGAAGASFQGLLQNSLADPYILGVSSGAALGSILGLALNLPFVFIPPLAFATAMLAMMLVYWAASLRRQISPHTLLLTGVILNAFLFAFILIINGLVSFEQSQKILFLLIGNIETESYSRIGLSATLVLLGIFLLTMEGHPLNLISSGQQTASTLGIDVARHRKRVFLLASLIVGAVVPLAGLIGFIGLFVPHITRMIFGPDHRLSIPASGWMGAMLLILCDAIARSLLVSGRFQTELPVGAVTAFLGAPFFLYLLRRGHR